MLQEDFESSGFLNLHPFGGFDVINLSSDDPIINSLFLMQISPI